MANKNLKSIKFPGLTDTYVVPQVDTTLTQTGRPADAKATGDAISALGDSVDEEIDALKEDFGYIVGEQNLFDGVSITQGYGINSSGDIVPVTGGAYTSLIPVTEQEYILRWATTSPNNNLRIHGYDSSGTWVKQVAYSNTGSPITFQGSGINSVRVSYYMPEHKLICLSEAKTVSDKIEAINDLKMESKALPNDYEVGAIVSNTGENSVNEKRLRTINYLSPLVEMLEVDNAYSFCIFAYNSEGTYVGVLNNEGTYLLNTLTWVKKRVLPLDDGYKFRIVLKKDNDAENMTKSMAENITYVYKVKKFADTVKYLFKQDTSLLNENKLYINEFVLGGVKVADGTDYVQYNRVRSNYIRVYPDTDITFESQDSSLYSGFYVFKYDANKTYIGSVTWSDIYRSDINGYVRLVCKKANESDISNPTDFNSCISVCRNFSNQLLRFINGNFSSYYKADAYEGVALNNTDIGYIYDRYDALVSAYPENISRNLLGYATATDGGDDTTKPIYEYVFKADADSRSTMPDAPTILLQSGTHGNEKSSVYGLLLFMEAMWNDDNDSLISIKSNFNIKVLPILNPYGYDANTRTNHRSVNINRNFGYRWDVNPDTDKGSAPYSEKETQILHDWVETNKNAFLYVDYHNMGDYDPYVSYVNTPCKTIQEIYTSFIRRTTNEWRERFYSDRKGNVYGWVNNDRIPCTYNEAYYEAGIYLSCTLEIAWDNEGVYYDATVIQTSMEQITNFVMAMIDCCRQ